MYHSAFLWPLGTHPSYEKQHPLPKKTNPME